MSINKNHLQTFIERLNNPKISYLENQQRKNFISKLKSFNLNNATALSISCGDGIWDYLALTNGTGINRIVATDIVQNPVKEEGIIALHNVGYWDFVKVEVDNKLPFKDNNFDVVYHQDVIEHTRKPYLSISEQYRVLRPGGGIFVGTPNIFRPANIVKSLLGRLRFPVCIGGNVEIGDYVHEQEFHEYQLQILMEEAGFINVTIDYVFLGLVSPNIMIKDFPKGGFGKTFAHFLVGSGFKE